MPNRRRRRRKRNFSPPVNANANAQVVAVEPAETSPPTTSTSETQTKPQQLKSPQLARLRKWLWQLAKETWVQVVALTSVVGLGLGLYVLRPFPLSGLSSMPEPQNPYSQVFTITNNGHLSMRDVRAGCIHSLILFENGDLMRAPKDVMLYSQPKDVEPGESFSITIAQASRLFTIGPKEKVITLGPPDKADTGYVKFTDIGTPTKHKHAYEAIHKHPPLLPMIKGEIPVLAIDAVLVVKYRMALYPEEITRSWRYTAHRNADKTITWRPRTAHEPEMVIPPGHHDELKLP